jgi:TonB family protein
MNEPRRLLDDGLDGPGLDLLRSARADAPPRAAKARTMAALGLAPEAISTKRPRGLARSSAPRRPGPALFQSVLGPAGQPSGFFGASPVGKAALFALNAALLALVLAALTMRRQGPLAVHPQEPEDRIKLNWMQPPPPPPEEAPVEAAAGEPVRISGRAPVYTREAIAARIEGTAQVKCVITADGSLSNCHILKSVPWMDAAVLDAMSTWRFAPVLAQGKPVSIDHVFTVRLVLPK